MQEQFENMANMVNMKRRRELLYNGLCGLVIGAALGGVLWILAPPIEKSPDNGACETTALFQDDPMAYYNLFCVPAK